MSSIVGVVRYGNAGNIHSIVKAIEKANGIVQIIEKPSDFDLVDRIVLPGVGSFYDGMTELKDRGLINCITSSKKPTLGICLGMQLLSKIGFEYGRSEGLGVINAEVKKIVCDGPVPHVGFNKIIATGETLLLKDLDSEYFYFMHSFEVVNYTNIVALTEYLGHEIVSVVKKDNFYGVQFHPEKSRDAGIKLFKNFLSI
ncbi:imidazole glycerol phosphate synthase subunit HisH [Aliivibrio kagoshimensis]|uniref:imidazole glycerol phosphate synthase subunit HisH n=1 Tax=Aliivibrio kagoshimensis TaxID=2910230 RepID=UPI003D1434B8